MGICAVSGTVDLTPIRADKVEGTNSTMEDAEIIKLFESLYSDISPETQFTQKAVARPLHDDSNN